MEGHHFFTEKLKHLVELLKRFLLVIALLFCAEASWRWMQPIVAPVGRGGSLILNGDRTDFAWSICYLFRVFLVFQNASADQTDFCRRLQRWQMCG